MDRKTIAFLVLATTAGSATAASASAGNGTATGAASNTGSGSNASTGKSVSSSTRRESSATFTGKNGLARVNGDTIEGRNGELWFNGIPYGTLTDTSVVKFTAKGKDKTLTVNGVPRTPLPKR